MFIFYNFKCYLSIEVIKNQYFENFNWAPNKEFGPKVFF